MLKTLLLVALAQGASGDVSRARQKLDCGNASSIRDFKAAVVEDSGWEHALAEEWARCACPKEADEAGWPSPRPELPAKWRGALPKKVPDSRAENVKRLVEGFLLLRQRPLPLTRAQATQIAECWYLRKEGRGSTPRNKH